MAKLGDITIFVEKEYFNDSVNVTGYAVERGEPFTDHVEAKPQKIELNAMITGRDYSSKINKLKNHMKKGTLLKFVGRSTAVNVVITDIGRTHEWTIGNGADVTIFLQSVRIAKSPWVKVPPKQRPGQKPPTRGGKKKPVSTKPRPTTAKYHVTRRGDTYYGLAIKYGSTIPQLRTWNKYPDRRIPIGVKLRVK